MTIHLENILPSWLTISDQFVFAVVFFAVILLLCCLAKGLLGKNSNLRHALIASLGLLVMYSLCVIIHTFQIPGIRKYLIPLPYTTFTETQMILIPLSFGDFPDLCRQILSMLVLSYLVNQINACFPARGKALGWLFSRLCCTLVAIFLHYLVYSILGGVFGQILTELVLDYAPMILVGLVLLLFALSFIKLILGLVFTAINPVLGGIFAFFFVHKIGKNINRAIGTTAVMTTMVLVLERIGYSSFPITPADLVRYIPFFLCTLLIWFMIGRK